MHTYDRDGSKHRAALSILDSKLDALKGTL
jgi:hypothetical protein